MMDIPDGIELIVFDLDGTLVKPQSVKVRPVDIRTGWGYRTTEDDWEWLFERKEAVRELSQHYFLALATNLRAVGEGHFSFERMEEELQKVATACGITYALACYYHKEARVLQWRKESNRRKPQPGMIIDAMTHYGVTAQETLMVGDRGDDEDAARNAGCLFVWADAFFGDIR